MESDAAKPRSSPAGDRSSRICRSNQCLVRQMGVTLGRARLRVTEHLPDRVKRLPRVRHVARGATRGDACEGYAVMFGTGGKRRGRQSSTGNGEATAPNRFAYFFQTSSWSSEEPIR